MTLKNYPGQLRPAIIYIHGGGWSGGSKNGIGSAFSKLAQSGYLCVSIDYRLSGEATFPAQIDDCKTAIRWVRAHAKQYKVDTAHIGVFGGSAGGHLAALMGTSGDIKSLEGKGDWQGFSTKVQAVVDLFGPADLTTIVQNQQRINNWRRAQTTKPPAGAVNAMLGGPVEKQLEKARIASPVTYITPDDPPFLIIHGDEDKVVSIEQSRNFYSKLTTAGVEATLKIYPGEGHGIRNPESQDIIVDFFKQKLPISPLF
jgi:acetyl esterase/lipase